MINYYLISIMAVAFKEWFVICEALANGHQDVIIRKGGISEGNDGFAFNHTTFYLFPTLFHKQSSLVKKQALQFTPQCDKKSWELGDTIEINYQCDILYTEQITEWDAVMNLSDRHVYAESLLRDRFDWHGKGMQEGSIHVAFVETKKIENPLVIEYRKSHRGCKSWIEL